MYTYPATCTRTQMHRANRVHVWQDVDMAKRGKQGDDRYRSLSGRIPADLRAAFKRKIADYDLDMTIDIFLERVVSMWVRGEIEVGTPNPPREPVASERYEPAHVTRARLAGTYTPEQRRAIWHLGEQDATAADIDESSPPTKPRKRKPKSTRRGGVVTYTDKTELGRLRKQLQYTQQDMADALDVAKSTVQRYESGKVRTPESALDMARALVDKGDSKND